MSNKHYIETQHTRISFYQAWWTFGWGLFHPLKLADLISAVRSDGSTAVNKRHQLTNVQHAYEELTARHRILKQEVAQLKEKVYFIAPSEEDPGQSWEEVCKEYMDITGTHNKTLAHRESVLHEVKAALEEHEAKAKKAGKPYKWMSNLVNAIKTALDTPPTEL